jgi:transposase-like protein
MNTRYIAEEYRLSHWAQIVQERKESGLSIRAYCESSGLHENTYYYWQKKLRDAVGDDLLKRHVDLASQTQHCFTEVKLAGRSALPPTERTQQGEISIEAAGIRITADSVYPIGNLATLLRMVVQPC